MWLLASYFPDSLYAVIVTSRQNLFITMNRAIGGDEKLTDFIYAVVIRTRNPSVRWWGRAP
jgi:hypothetical protein